MTRNRWPGSSTGTDSRLPARAVQNSSSTSSSSIPKPSWIDENILRLECKFFIPSRKNKLQCGCGRMLDKHQFAENVNGSDQHLHLPLHPGVNRRWQSKHYTSALPTDAYGTLEFQGGPHPTKARYIRLHFDTKPEDILHLLLQEWKLQVPNLVISVLGGLSNFDLQPKLRRFFQDGLIKAVKTTGAWIITTGLDTGVTKHVGDALAEDIHTRGSRIVALGIAPWGIVQHRDILKGKENVCPYHSISMGTNNQAVLNEDHNFFLLADNGTSGKYGGEIYLRRRLEQYLAQQAIDMRRYGGTKSRVPVVAVLVEGGMQAFRMVFELVTDKNPVPVVVCDGSGRAADLLAFMHRYAQEDGNLPHLLQERMLSTVKRTFALSTDEANSLYTEMKLCLKRRDLISIFRIGDPTSTDIDNSILKALLSKSQPFVMIAARRNLTLPEQLSYTMAWNRPDIARQHVFKHDQFESSRTHLETAMLDALINDRLEFVKLLLEQGVSMTNFLTKSRLEYLYSVRNIKGNENFRRLLTKIIGSKVVSLRAVGQLLQLLIGNGYQHLYCQKPDRATLQSKGAAGLATQATGSISTSKPSDLNTAPYRYPYTELLQWTLLTRRYELARYMMLSGEESIAKALMAVKVLRGLRKKLDSDFEMEYTNELKNWEQEFESEAVLMQDHCYMHCPEQAKRLLTYELSNFSNNTCLSLAFMCESKAFLSHVCTQTTLNDLWYGGLRESALMGGRVTIMLFATVLPPFIPFLIYVFSQHGKFLEFKTKEELALQAQTLQEYLDEQSSSSSSSSDSEDSSISFATDKDAQVNQQQLVIPVDLPITTMNRNASNISRRTSSIKRLPMVTVTARLKLRGGTGLHSLPQAHEPLLPEEEPSPPLPSIIEASNRLPLSGAYSCPNLSEIPMLKEQGSSVPGSSHDLNKRDQLPADVLVEEGRAPLDPLTRVSVDTGTAHHHHHHHHQDRVLDRDGRLGSVKHHKKHHHHSESIRKRRISADSRNSIVGYPLRSTNSNIDHYHSRERLSCDNLPAAANRSLARNSVHATMPHFRNFNLTNGYNTRNQYPYSVNNFPAPYIQAPTDLAINDVAVPTRRPLTAIKRIYEFYSAPITRYYLHLILYLIFVGQFVCLSIISVPRENFTVLEIFVYLHILTYFIDKFREVSLSGGTTYWQKMKVHLDFFWNKYDYVMCLISLVGIALRTAGMYSEVYYMRGRNMLVICCALWLMRIIELMQIWRIVGSYIYMAVRMINAMFPAVILLFIPLLSFGVVRQGIMFPNNTEVTLESVKGLMLKPYFMLYGEVYAGEIDPVDWPANVLEAPLKEFVPITMVLYLLVAIIVMISIIIAQFNDIYGSVRAQSELVYKYLRYGVIIEYESRPLLPPPLIIISWLYIFIRWLVRMRKATPDNRKITEHSAGLKLFLNQDEIEKLHDFEEECVEDYCRQKLKTEKLKQDRQIIDMHSKVESLQYRLEEVYQRQSSLHETVRILDQESVTNSERNEIALEYVTDGMQRLEASLRTTKNTIKSFRQSVLRQRAVPDTPTPPAAVWRPPMIGGIEEKSFLRSPLYLQCDLDPTAAAADAQIDSSSPDTPPPPPMPTRRVRRNSRVRGLNHSTSIPGKPSSPDGEGGLAEDTGVTPPVTPLPLGLTRMPSLFSGRSALGGNAHRRDYTTICDAIDVDLIEQGESPRSSQNGSQQNLVETFPPISEKEAGLRQAEKLEREEMKDILLTRLRQLSHTESKEDSEVLADYALAMETLGQSSDCRSMPADLNITPSSIVDTYASISLADDGGQSVSDTTHNPSLMEPVGFTFLPLGENLNDDGETSQV